MDEGVKMRGRSLEAPPGPPLRKLLPISVTLPSPIPPNPYPLQDPLCLINLPAGTDNLASIRLDETIHPSSKKSNLTPGSPLTSAASAMPVSIPASTMQFFTFIPPCNSSLNV